MGDILNKVALKMTDAMFELWDKGQIIVTLTRTKFGINVIFVGNKEETIKNIIRLVQVRTQWTNFIENILKLITVNNQNSRRELLLRQTSFLSVHAIYTYLSVSQVLYISLFQSKQKTTCILVNVTALFQGCIIITVVMGLLQPRLHIDDHLQY